MRVRTGRFSDRGYYLAAEAITIPFWSRGKIAYLVFYRPNWEPKYFYPKGWSQPLLRDEYVINGR